MLLQVLLELLLLSGHLLYHLLVLLENLPRETGAKLGVLDREGLEGWSPGGELSPGEGAKNS